MKKWKFKLESLLKFRTQLTDEAMGIYAHAQAELDEALRDLEKLYNGVDENFKATQQMREQGGLTSEILKTHDEFFDGQQIRIERQKQKVRELKVVAEEKYAILVEKMQEQKAIEKIKEKQHDEFKLLLKKKEQKDLDDINLMRGRRGRAI